MKFNEKIVIVVTPDGYAIDEPIENRPDTIGNISKIRDPRFDVDEPVGEANLFSGGRFKWGLAQFEEHQDDPLLKVQLMRLWATTMYTQMAAGLSYTDQVDSNIKSQLTDEEIETLSTINRKITDGIFDEIRDVSGSITKKKKMKKLDF